MIYFNNYIQALLCSYEQIRVLSPSNHNRFFFLSFSPFLSSNTSLPLLISLEEISTSQLFWFGFLNSVGGKEEESFVGVSTRMEKRIFLLLLLMVFGNQTFTAFCVRVPICAPRSVKDYTFLELPDPTCPLSDEPLHFLAVTEGDERWLQTALDMIHENKCNYVALLFYASWCPFSTSFRPTFHVISSLYSSIPHFAIKDSSVKPSTLSKYGVHGFPTLLLVNSTMVARYRGTRLLDSLVAFYSDVTGIETLDKTSIEKSVPVPHLKGDESNTEPENCPFTWARSPENMIRQETCLALAVVFVLLRLLYLVYPALVVLMKYTWRRIAHNTRRESLQEHTVGFLSRAVQLCIHLIER